MVQIAQRHPVGIWEFRSKPASGRTVGFLSRSTSVGYVRFLRRHGVNIQQNKFGISWILSFFEKAVCYITSNYPKWWRNNSLPQNKRFMRHHDSNEIVAKGNRIHQKGNSQRLQLMVHVNLWKIVSMAYHVFHSHKSKFKAHKSRWRCEVKNLRIVFNLHRHATHVGLAAGLLLLRCQLILANNHWSVVWFHRMSKIESLVIEDNYHECELAASRSAEVTAPRPANTSTKSRSLVAVAYMGCLSSMSHRLVNRYSYDLWLKVCGELRYPTKKIITTPVFV